ncbi:MAG: hypothetical protein COB59_10475 [Rhodospirillaceae bacterium]|nr:MAG: hypothetical protein COB59_10475 [Rhodospirillaceae bacterium]
MYVPSETKALNIKGSPSMSYNATRKLFSAERSLLLQRGIEPDQYLNTGFSSGSGSSNAEVLASLNEIKNLIKESTAASNAAAEAVANAAPAPIAADKEVDVNLPEMSVLRGQLKELKESIDKTKSEIAALHKPADGEDDRFVTAAMELDAIVKATEVATNNILGSAEEIDDWARLIKERIDDVASHDHLDSISGAVISIFENCNFQDITGQRTSKVVKTINFLEERILTMINIWGEEEFEGIELPEDLRSEDEKLLSGPQLEGAGISQDDIDSLFD